MYKTLSGATKLRLKSLPLSRFLAVFVPGHSPTRKVRSSIERISPMLSM